VHRGEVYKAIQEQNVQASTSDFRIEDLLEKLTKS
jgi:sRNA-binding carbon storage regulator CsrA